MTTFGASGTTVASVLKSPSASPPPPPLDAQGGPQPAAVQDEQADAPCAALGAHEASAVSPVQVWMDPSAGRKCASRVQVQASAAKAPSSCACARSGRAQAPSDHLQHDGLAGMRPPHVLAVFVDQGYLPHQAPVGPLEVPEACPKPAGLGRLPAPPSPSPPSLQAAGCPELPTGHALSDRRQGAPCRPLRSARRAASAGDTSLRMSWIPLATKRIWALPLHSAVLVQAEGAVEPYRGRGHGIEVWGCCQQTPLFDVGHEALAEHSPLQSVHLVKLAAKPMPALAWGSWH